MLPLPSACSAWRGGSGRRGLFGGRLPWIGRARLGEGRHLGNDARGRAGHRGCHGRRSRILGRHDDRCGRGRGDRRGGDRRRSPGRVNANEDRDREDADGDRGLHKRRARSAREAPDVAPGPTRARYRRLASARPPTRRRSSRIRSRSICSRWSEAEVVANLLPGCERNLMRDERRRVVAAPTRETAMPSRVGATSALPRALVVEAVCFAVAIFRFAFTRPGHQSPARAVAPRPHRSSWRRSGSLAAAVPGTSRTFPRWRPSPRRAPIQGNLPPKSQLLRQQSRRSAEATSRTRGGCRPPPSASHHSPRSLLHALRPAPSTRATSRSRPAPRRPSFEQS